MIKSKLIQLLRTFSKEEFRNFGKFVRSPYFYKDKAVIKLYDSLKPFYPDYDSEGLTKHLLFEKMFPKKHYSDTQMKYLMSEMLGMGKKFLSYVNYKRDPFKSAICLLKELYSRNTSKIFETELVKLEGNIKNSQIRNLEYFHNNYDLKKLVSDFYSYKDRLSIKREHNKVIENITHVFLISLLDTYYEITNDAAEYRVNIDLKFMSFIDQFMEQKTNTINPVVHISYRIFMLSYLNEEENYLKLLELKNKYLYTLDDDGKHRIFEALGNYCINQYHKFGIKYYKEAFILINDEIKYGVRFNRNEFSEIFFMNKVEIASKVKEFKWADDFIVKYKNRLNKEHKDDIVNFSYAIIEFERKNFQGSLDHLAQINLHHPFLRFRIRNYTLLNYYELNYPDQAYLMLDAYKHMLVKDNKIEKSRKERYYTFLRLYQKLMETRMGNKKNEKGFLKQEISTKAALMKEWLLEKVNQL